MKKLMMVAAAIAGLSSMPASAGQHAMLSVFAPAQLPAVQENLNGVRLNLLWGDVISMNGLDLGVSGRTRENFCGAQAALCSVVGADAAGAQLGAANFVSAGFTGFQFALWNEVGGAAAGFQLGLVNRAASLKGVQLGLVNFVGERESLGGCMPLLNLGW